MACAATVAFFHFTLLFPHPKMHTLLNSNCHFFQGLKYITWFLLLIMLIVVVVEEKSLPYWKFTKVSFWDWGGSSGGMGAIPF